MTILADADPDARRGDAPAEGDVGVGGGGDLVGRIEARGGPGGAAFDCSWRRLAYSYAPQLQTMTQSKAKELFDALELGTMCNETFDSSTRRPVKWAPVQWNDLRGWIEAYSATGFHGGADKAPLNPKKPCGIREPPTFTLLRLRSLPENRRPSQENRPRNSFQNQLRKCQVRFRENIKYQTNHNDQNSKFQTCFGH